MERLVRRHSVSTPRSVSGACIAFSAEASASKTDSWGSLILDISFCSAMRQIQFVHASLAEMWLPGCDRSSTPLTEAATMLWMYSCNPASCSALPAHYMHVVLAPVWGRANSGAKLSSSSSGHVQGTHSSPTLGCCSLTSYLSQFPSPAGKAFFYLHPISPQMCKPKPCHLLLPLLSWLTIPQAQRLTLWSDSLGMLCSTLFLHGRTALYCRILLPPYSGTEYITGSNTVSLAHNL